MTSPQNLGEKPSSKDETVGIGEKTLAPAGQGKGVTGAKPDAPNVEPTAGSSAQNDKSQTAESIPTDSDAVVEADTLSVNTPGEELDMSAFEEELGDSGLVKALAKIAELEDQLARAYADLYSLNQEYSNYVHCSKEAAPGHRGSGQSEALEALIDAPDNTGVVRTHGNLDDDLFAFIAGKLEPVLNRRFFLECFGQEGEDFDPAFHEAPLVSMNPEVDRPIIAKVLQSGYCRAERVLRAAKAMMDNPE